MKCDNCGKGIMYGHNVSHAKNRTKRTFKPNLHSTRIVINDIGKRMRLCTKCLRRYKNRMQKHQVKPIGKIKSVQSSLQISNS